MKEEKRADSPVMAAIKSEFNDKLHMTLERVADVARSQPPVARRFVVAIFADGEIQTIEGVQFEPDGPREHYPKMRIELYSSGPFLPHNAFSMDDLKDQFKKRNIPFAIAFYD